MIAAPLLLAVLLGDVGAGTPGFTPPVRIRSAKPVYPAKEQKAGTTGVVVLDILIDEQGNVADTDVKASPGEAFSRAAVECVKKWKFRPGTANGEPRAFRQTVTIDFKLKTTPTPTAPTPPPAPSRSSAATGRSTSDIL